MFFKKDVISPGISKEIAKINVNTIIESFNTIGCDAFSPGSQDFAAGFEFLKSAEQEAEFPFISSNIMDENNNLLFEPYSIVSKGGISVGFVGASSIFTHTEVNVSEPIEAISQFVSELENKVDMVVLLFSATEQDLSRLYEKELNIDLILRSKSRKRSSDGGSKIPTFTAGDRGKYLFQFDVTMTKQGEVFTDIVAHKNKMDHAHKRLDNMKKGNLMVDLQELYKDDSATLKKIDNYENQINKAQAGLDEAINTIVFTKHELDKKIMDRPDVLLIVDAGKQKVSEISTPTLPPNSHKNHNHSHKNHNH